MKLYKGKNRFHIFVHFFPSIDRICVYIYIYMGSSDEKLFQTITRFMVENIEEDLKPTSISSKVILDDRVWRKNYRGAMVLKIFSSITRNP